MQHCSSRSYTSSVVDQLAIHTVYAPQLPAKKPGFLYEANICLQLLQALGKNVTGGFALVQINLQYLYHVTGGFALVQINLRYFYQNGFPESISSSPPDNQSGSLGNRPSPFYTPSLAQI